MSLDKTNLELLERNDYLVSWKADGTRYMMLITMIDNKQRVFMVGRDNVYFEMPYFRFPCSQNVETQLMDDTLLDGELVLDRWTDNHGPQQRFTYLAYDLICCYGKVRTKKKKKRMEEEEGGGGGEGKKKRKRRKKKQKRRRKSY